MTAAEPDIPSPPGRRQKWLLAARLPLVVLLCALAGGAGVWQHLQQQSRAFEIAALDHKADAFAAGVAERLRAFGQTLRGAEGMFAIGNRVSRETWRRYASHLDLKTQYPGIIALGYLRHLPAGDVPAHEAEVRAEGFAAYRVEPPVRGTHAAPVTYLEPFSGRNFRVFGFNAYSDPVRSEAMARARDTGTIALSGVVTLLQDRRSGASGMGLFAPLYRGGSLPGTPADRQDRLEGFVYISFYASELFAGLVDAERDGVDVVVTDRTNPRSAQTLFSTLRDDAPRAGEDGVERQLSLGGRHVAVTYRARPAAGAGRVNDTIIVLLWTGASLLLAGLVYAATRTRQRAETLASRMTSELAGRSNELETQRRLLDRVIQAVPVIVSLKDAGGRIVLINAEAERFHGKPVSHFIGKTDFDLYPPEQAQRIREQDLAVARQDAVVTIEEGFANVGGHESFVVKRKVAVTMPDGQRGVLTCLYDVTQLRQAERDAERARSFLSSIMDAVSLGVFVKDTAHRWVMANRAFAAQVGRPPEELIGKTDRDFVADAAAREAWQQDDLVLQTGAPMRLEQRMDFHDGTEGWFEKVKTRLTLPDGSPFVVGIMRDVTEVKRAELALRQSEERWAAIVRTAHEGILVLDESGAIQSANPSVSRIFGYGAEALANRDASNLMPSLPELMRQDAQHRDARSSEESDASSHSVVGVHQDGSRLDIEVSISAFRLGERTLFTAILRDQSELVRQRDIAQQTERVAGVGGWEVDLINGRLFWTDETYRIHEADPAQYQPALATAIDFYAEEHRDVVRNAVEHAIAQREGWDLVAQIVTARGKRVWVRAVGQVVVHDGIAVKAYGAIQDVTLQREIEDRLRRHQEELQELVEARTEELVVAKNAAEGANRAKSEFLANMSHELRTPMHAMLSFAQLGASRSGSAQADTAKLCAYFGKIESSGRRLLNLVNDLLDLSKMEAGRMTYEFARHDLGELVRGALAEFEPLAAQRRIVLALELPQVPVAVALDSVRMGQVIRNLLSNAMKFSPDGEAVTVSVGATQLASRSCCNDGVAVDAVELRVRDRGLGIPAGELEVIFDKFVQSSKTRSGAGGTGLGLAICREIVHAHGGVVYASHAPGSGALFTVTLPASLCSRHTEEEGKTIRVAA